MSERRERCGCAPLEYGIGPDNTTCDVHGQESERRDRYAAVFVEHPVYDARTLHLATDAVMAVADEEQRKLTAEVAALVATIFRAHKENNRLRAELAEMTADRDSWKDTFYEQG